MTKSQRRWIALLGLCGALAAASAKADGIVTPPRPGQVGIGIQGQYGTLLDTGSIGKEFGSGGGLAVRLRYRMRYERAIGLSFESQRADARVQTTADTSAMYLSLGTYGVDVYQMFGTRTRTTQMVSVGVGLVQARIKLNDKEVDFRTSDGFYASFGAGLERFVWQSWAIDASARYFALFQDGTTTHDVRASLGFMFYASY